MMPMKLDLGKTELKINVSFAAAVTLMLILDVSGFCAVALFCCAVHEAGHIICLLIMGEKPKLIELSFYGVKLERAVMSENSRSSEPLVYASGPAANFMLSALLFVLGNKFPGLHGAAVTSLGIGIFNLIPCRPLDGGNLLSVLMCRFLNEKTADVICLAVKFLTVIPMVIIGVVMLVKAKNFTLIGVAVYLVSVDFFNKKSTI